MPKPLLKKPEVKANTDLLSVNYQQKKQNQMDPLVKNRLLRKKRSQQYIAAIHQLDAGGHVHNQQKVNDIINCIKEEFPEIDILGNLLGIISKCYLGNPYEVHTLDIANSIIEHYVKGQPLPDGLDKARGLALMGGYDFIEVYDNCCRAVSMDGTVSVILD